MHLQAVFSLFFNIRAQLMLTSKESKEDFWEEPSVSRHLHIVFINERVEDS